MFAASTTARNGALRVSQTVRAARTTRRWASTAAEKDKYRIVVVGAGAYMRILADRLTELTLLGRLSF